MVAISMVGIVIVGEGGVGVGVGDASLVVRVVGDEIETNGSGEWGELE